ncbi:MAG: lipopolysaccharide biosynthesis protein [Bryobacteraceae bacterium]
MTPASSEAGTALPRAVSLRSNFIATFAGNAVYAATQWAVLSLIAKLGSAEMLGEYALAVAIATPVAMLSHLNLRAVLATDIQHRRPFGDYLSVRVVTTGAGLAVVIAIALLAGYPAPLAAVVCLTGASLAAENVSDIYYGALQRREHMTRIAYSMIVRGVASAAALGIVLALTRNLVWAAAAMALVRLAVLFAFDKPAGSRGESMERTSVHAQFALFRTALPLGIVLMLSSLTANLPRYAIETELGTRALGAFAAVASFLAVGSTIINALGQSATPRLARHFSAHEFRAFRILALKLCGLAAGVGLSGVAVALLLGEPVLELVYRPEYGQYSILLVGVMLAGIPAYVANMLGYVITSTRSFASQMPLLGAAAAASALASWSLAPSFGLAGAVGALGVAASVQILGALWILWRTLRASESAV